MNLCAFHRAQLGSVGAAPSGSVDVVGGAQVAKPMVRDLVLSWLGQLYFTMPTAADASHQRYSAVPCVDAQKTGANCNGPNALDTLKSVPPGALVLANLTTVNPSRFVDVIVASSPVSARYFAAPGSDWAVIQGSMGGRSGTVTPTRTVTVASLNQAAIRATSSVRAGPVPTNFGRYQVRLSFFRNPAIDPNWRPPPSAQFAEFAVWDQPNTTAVVAQQVAEAQLGKWWNPNSGGAPTIPVWWPKGFKFPLPADWCVRARVMRATVPYAGEYAGGQSSPPPTEWEEVWAKTQCSGIGVVAIAEPEAFPTGRLNVTVQWQNTQTLVTTKKTIGVKADFLSGVIQSVKSAHPTTGWNYSGPQAPHRLWIWNNAPGGKMLLDTIVTAETLYKALKSLGLTG